MARREFTPEEKEEYKQRKLKEKEEFLDDRREATIKLEKDDDFYRRYLLLQPFLSESCLNTVWLAYKNADGTIFHTVNDWARMGMEVDRNTTPTSLLSSESYVAKDGKERMGYRVISVYSNTQLKAPYKVQNTDLQTVETFIDLLKSAIAWKITVDEEELETPYKVVLEEDNGKIVLAKGLSEDPTAYAFYLAIACSAFFLEQRAKEHNKEYLWLIDKALTAYDAGFLICAKYLDPDVLKAFPTSAERFEGLRYVEGKSNYNKELKAQRSIADFYCKRIKNEIKKRERKDS